MATAAEGLTALLRAAAPDGAAIAAHLDGLEHAGRVEAIRALRGPRLQRRLWDAVASTSIVTLDELVPADAPPLREFVFEGKNSLPLFTHFQKRFCRPSRDTGRDELWGYNHTDVARLIGPGYFVCHRVDERGAAIDYREVPPEHPSGWPAIRPNSAGLSRFVYNGMVDHLRRVSSHVYIGSAYRDDRELGNFFVLCRAS